jgi:hypothetical protein
MSEDCNKTKHPLFRDGTSQQQRLLKSLLPAYVSVDERSMEDLIAFAKKYAEEIFYYDQGNNPSGNWVDFFTHAIDAKTSGTEPHYALFIAFLDLFRLAQDNLNTITQRHLDFYYREVLQLKEKAAIPDQVFVVFELAKQTATAVVTKDTLLKAGKDGLGKDLTYKTDRELAVNKAVVQELKAVFSDKTQDYRIYASPVANSGDGIGGKLSGDEPKWRTFGRNGFFGADRPQADIGFAFASPVLFMAEGNRAVSVRLTFNKTLTGLSEPVLSKALRMQFSGEKAWIDPEKNDLKIPADTVTLGANQITINATVTSAQPAIVAYNASKLGASFRTSWPVVRILLNNQNNSFLYSQLKDLVLVKAEVLVDVKGVKNLVLFNDNAKLKADKPFEPFTNRPVSGSAFYIGSTEVFSKKLDSVDVDITWQGLPSCSLHTYYHNYIPAYNRNNLDFKADVSVIDGKNWIDMGPQRLFDEKALNSVATIQGKDIEKQIGPTTTVAATVSTTLKVSSPLILTLLLYSAPPNEQRRITIDVSALKNIPRDSNMAPATAVDDKTFKGFMRLELTGVDFGHKDYAVSLTKHIVANDKIVVNVPYTPTVKEIALNYKSSVTVDFSQNTQETFNNRIDQFYHVQPFGVNEIHPFIFIKPTPISLVPQFKEEGNLYIGLKGLKPAQILSVLFKVSEGSANPDFAKQQVQWSYLVNNQWVEFPKLKVLAEGTNGLLTSGIVSFDVPSTATNDNTILTSGLYWIRASVTDFSGAVCDLVDVKAQAVMATFLDNENDPEHLRLPLPAETVKKFLESNPAIPKVAQPFASFGGKVKEQSTDFYIRVSERLRHKHRAVTIWDYERLVLEKFPSVYKVKCISHTEDKPALYSEVAPGHVTLITVSNLRNKNVVNPLQPKTSLTLMDEIHTYITSLTSCWVELDVRNPEFEEIRTTFNVRFLPGFDNGFYGDKLNEDLKKFLSPWSYDSGADITFGGKIHKSSILKFVEEQEYVDFVSCFRMDHITATQVFADIDEAVTTSAASVLVSVTQHTIAVLESDDCACDDNIQVNQIMPADDVTCDVRTPTPPQKGIGSDELNENFIVGYSPETSGVDYFEIENDFNVS